MLMSHELADLLVPCDSDACEVASKRHLVLECLLGGVVLEVRPRLQSFGSSLHK